MTKFEIKFSGHLKFVSPPFHFKGVEPGFYNEKPESALVVFLVIADKNGALHRFFIADDDIDLREEFFRNYSLISTCPIGQEVTVSGYENEKNSIGQRIHSFEF